MISEITKQMLNVINYPNFIYGKVNLLVQHFNKDTIILINSPNSMKLYGRETVSTRLPNCDVNSPCKSSRKLKAKRFENVFSANTKYTTPLSM